MPTKLSLTYLLASPDPALLAALEPVLAATGVQVEIVLSLEATLASIAAPRTPTLALLDATLPGMDPRMNIERLLATVRAGETTARLPIVLISDTVTQGWIDRLAEGVIDDLILRTAELPYWPLRVEMVLRNRHASREIQTLREAQVLNAQFDRLTGVYNRETILSMLFRETDRVQRMNSALTLLLLDINDFGHWNSRLGNDACDDLLCQVSDRIARLLRSYDLLGRPGMDEFLLVLPGCSAVNAFMLAERMRVDVFSLPFRVGSDAIRLSACFGIAALQLAGGGAARGRAGPAMGAHRRAGVHSMLWRQPTLLQRAGHISFFLERGRPDGLVNELKPSVPHPSAASSRKGRKRFSLRPEVPHDPLVHPNNSDSA